jgi:DNA-binding LytR/AlgR family response regulator
MKLRVEVVDGLEEDEVLIRCGRADETVRKIQQYIQEQYASAPEFTFYKQNQEFYFPLDEVLFFETEGDYIYAHTTDDAYRIKYRLYELEKILPRYFVRAAKSTIVNIRRVYSISKSLASSSLIRFADSHKQVYVSRFYYQELRLRLKERSLYEK